MAEALGGTHADAPVATELVGTETPWEPVACEPARVAQFADVARLRSQPLLSDRMALPPTYLVGQHIDTAALGIPDAPVRLNGGNWCRAGQPAWVGDALERSTRIADVSRKPGRSGVLVIYELETRWRRISDGALVATHGHSTIRRYPHPPGASPQPPSEKGRSADPPVREPQTGAATLEVTPSSRDLVRYAACTGDYYEAHYDQAFARSRGFADVIVHGLLKFAWLATAALDHCGPGYTLREVRASYRGTDLVGQPFRVWCASTERAAGDGPVGVRLAGISVDGTVSTIGSARLTR